MKLRTRPGGGRIELVAPVTSPTSRYELDVIEPPRVPGLAEPEVVGPWNVAESSGRTTAG